MLIGIHDTSTHKPSNNTNKYYISRSNLLVGADCGTVELEVVSCTLGWAGGGILLLVVAGSAAWTASVGLDVVGKVTSFVEILSSFLRSKRLF